MLQLSNDNWLFSLVYFSLFSSFYYSVNKIDFIFIYVFIYCSHFLIVFFELDSSRFEISKVKIQFPLPVRVLLINSYWRFCGPNACGDGLSCACALSIRGWRHNMKCLGSLTTITCTIRPQFTDDRLILACKQTVCESIKWIYKQHVFNHRCLPLPSYSIINDAMRAS